MKRFFIILITLLAFCGANAQVFEEIEETNKNEIPDTNYFISDGCPEIAPAYPGGEQALHKFLKKNLDISCMDSCGEGKVYITFVVDSTGSLIDLQIPRPFCKKCDDEVTRVFSIMPKWIPGTMGKKKVKVRYHFPISFKKRIK